MKVSYKCMGKGQKLVFNITFLYTVATFHKIFEILRLERILKNEVFI